MDACASNRAVVLQGRRPIGYVTRANVERLRQNGNWIGCIAAMDAMDHEPKRSG